MQQQLPPLGAEEQHLSNQIAQLITQTLQVAGSLSSFEVTAPAENARLLEQQLLLLLKQIRSLLNDLKYAAEEQET